VTPQLAEDLLGVGIYCCGALVGLWILTRAFRTRKVAAKSPSITLPPERVFFESRFFPLVFLGSAALLVLGWFTAHYGLAPEGALGVVYGWTLGAGLFVLFIVGPVYAIMASFNAFFKWFGRAS
jgi:hypothetical protein